MREIHWTNEAIVALAALPPAGRALLLERLSLIAEFPDIYPRRQRGRFVGLRYFVPERRWLVYYRHTPEDRVLVFAIVPALARPR